MCGIGEITGDTCADTSGAWDLLPCQAEEAGRVRALRRQSQQPRSVVANSGEPRDMQSLVGLSKSSPLFNVLGPHHTTVGSFEAVQIQADLFGDTVGADWYRTQTALTSGNVRTQSGRPSKAVFSDNLDDRPPAYAIYAGDGTYDWLDTPGWRTGNGPVNSASLTFDCTSTLTNRYTNASCSVSWGFRLSILRNKWRIIFF